MMNKNEQSMALEAQIISLRAKLTANTSEIGDWKIAKTYEARLQNEPDPYNTEELLKARQDVRNKINEAQAKLAKLKP